MRIVYTQMGLKVARNLSEEKFQDRFADQSSVAPLSIFEKDQVAKPNTPSTTFVSGLHIVPNLKDNAFFKQAPLK